MTRLRRRRWQLPSIGGHGGVLAIALASNLLGDVIWTVYEAIGSKPYPSLADVFYLLFYPIMLWGLLVLPGQRRSFAERIRFGLDLAVVGISGAAVVT